LHNSILVESEGKSFLLFNKVLTRKNQQKKEYAQSFHISSKTADSTPFLQMKMVYLEFSFLLKLIRQK